MDAADFLTGEKNKTIQPKPWMLEKTLALVTKWGSVEKPESKDLPDAWSGSEDSLSNAAGTEWAMLDQVIDACIERVGSTHVT